MFKDFVCRFAKPHWLCLWLMANSLHANADLEFLNTQLMEPNDAVIVAAEYSYFDISLDFLDFASKVNSSSTPENSTSTQVSLIVPVTDRLQVGYEYKNATAEVSRVVEPLKTEAQGQTHHLSANYMVGYFADLPFFINIAGSSSKQDTLEIDCYSHAGIVLGGTCDTADVSLFDGTAFINNREKNYYPAMIIDGRAQVYRIGLEFRGQFFKSLPFYQKLDFQSSKTDLTYQAKILEIEDSFLLNASFKGKRLGDTINSLSSQLPQKTPWTEQAIIIEFGSKIQLMPSISTTLAIKHYHVNRKDYEYGENEVNYKNNTVLNLALWFEPNDRFKIYLRGEASSHNLLGMDPLAYNRKTSKFFAQPHGQISLGTMLKF